MKSRTTETSNDRKQTAAFNVNNWLNTATKELQEVVNYVHSAEQKDRKRAAGGHSRTKNTLQAESVNRLSQPKATVIKEPRNQPEKPQWRKYVSNNFSKSNLSPSCWIKNQNLQPGSKEELYSNLKARKQKSAAKPDRKSEQ